MLRQKITPCLWFDGQAEEAAAFYTSLFPGSAVTGVTPGPDGKPLVVEFQLAGSRFLALNGGPHFKFNEAISLSIDCQTQAEVDELWKALRRRLPEPVRMAQGPIRRLLAGGAVGALPALLADPARAGRVMQALMGMTKLDIPTLEAAARGQ